MSISALEVCKKFGTFTALDHVDVEAPSGALLALLGPSGSGKTTLLRIIAGLEVADSGCIRYADEEVTNASARDRKAGFVFQHYALFRHMTVFENVAFGLRVRKWTDAQVRKRVMELLELVRLEELAHRYPSQLSGGQKQRIALVRSLAPQPKVLLLDEPFGALDAKVRQELRGWLRRFHDELHVTSIFVTHDQEEAFEVADQIVVMNKGRIEQSGTPSQVFEHPANAFVMDFLGNVNIFPSHLFGDDHSQTPPNGTPKLTDTGKVQLYVRPHELSIHRMPVGSGSLPARVVHINPAGSVVKVRLIAEAFGLVVNVDVERDRFVDLNLSAGEHVHISPRKVRAFTPDYAI